MLSTRCAIVLFAGLLTPSVASAAWPVYEATSPSCPAWALCEAVPGPGSSALFESWVATELGIPGALGPDLDADSNEDTPGSIVDDELVIGETDFGKYIILGPQGSECPFCIQVVEEDPLSVDVADILLAFDANDDIGVWAVASGQGYTATVDAVAEIQHGQGHGSYQLLVEATNGDDYLVVVAHSAVFIEKQ